MAEHLALRRCDILFGARVVTALCWIGLLGQGASLSAAPMAAVAAAKVHSGAPSASTDVIEQHPMGTINWSHHLWRVRGRSAPVSAALSFGGPIRQAGGALTLASADARNRLSALRQSMYWGPQEVQDAQRGDTHPPTPNAAIAWGEARLIATQFFSDGHVAVTQDFCWDGALAETLWQARNVAEKMRLEATAKKQENTKSTVPADVLAQVPTGLIINARGLKTRPALLPEVRDVAGAVLYDVGHVHPEALSHYGVARFSYSLDAAIKDERMGAHPAVVRAHATLPAAPWVFVVDARQATVVQAAQPALSGGKVIVVIDEMDVAPQVQALMPTLQD